MERRLTGLLERYAPNNRAKVKAYRQFNAPFTLALLTSVRLVGAIVGGVLILFSPYLSRKLALARGGQIYPFQGMVITLLLLVSAATVLGVTM